MATLLVLGSKPDPVLPPVKAFDAVACANASGYSAAKHGLPDPLFTAVSGVLTIGIGSGKQSMKAMSGLHTNTLYFVPRTSARANLVKNLVILHHHIRATPVWFRYAMKRAGFRWDRFERKPFNDYLATIPIACRDDADFAEQLDRKRPSTGLVALLIGLSLSQFDRFIISGFSFELTHAYGKNPEIAERGTAVSRHGDTDVLLLRCLSKTLATIYTTEPTVHERADVPLLGATEF